MELEQLKKVLRSLAVSSPTRVDMSSLTRDYRNMMGEPIPISKYGYRDLYKFLREQCEDCFLMQGPAMNPTLILIVPKSLEHIDEHVRKQKISSTSRFKEKRRSVSENALKKPSSLYCPPHLRTRRPPANPAPPQPTSTNVKSTRRTTDKQESSRDLPHHYEAIQETSVYNGSNKVVNHTSHTNGLDTVSDPAAVQNFFKKRLPQLNDMTDKEFANTRDDDSGRLTSSSCSSGKRAVLDELRSEIRELISEHPGGLWSVDLLRLYRERYGREVPVERLGLSASIHALARALSDVVVLTRPEACGDWRVWDARAPPAPGASPPRRRLRLPHQPPAAALQGLCEDALPGIDFDPSVFPEDCMHHMDAIPALSLDDIAPHDMIELCVGEIYSPSHLWVLRLGDQHRLAMDNIMDEMTKYYNTGEGRTRVLSPGAVRAGHYCTSLYERDWHRALIVQVIDVDTVKVRHVDYGTVCRAPAASLKPLRREWGRLPAQAVRARLAAVRPIAGSRRWPHAASRRLLDLIRDKPLVGNVLAVDYEESILELHLVDTSTEEDFCINSALVAEGFADVRAGSALLDQTPEAYLYPRFDALETGETPNFEDISAFLRAGISLQFVEEYRRHVPLGEDFPRAQGGLQGSRQAGSVGVVNRIPMPLPAAAAEQQREYASSDNADVSVKYRDDTTPPGHSRLDRATLLRLSSIQLGGHIQPAGRPMSGSGQLSPGVSVRSDSEYLQSGNQPKPNCQPSGYQPTLNSQLPSHGQASSSSADFQPGGHSMPGNGQCQPGGQPTPATGQLRPAGTPTPTPTPTPRMLQPGGQSTSGSAQFQPGSYPMAVNGQFQTGGQQTPGTGQFQPAGQPTTGTGQFQPAGQPTTGTAQFQPAGQPTTGTAQFQPAGQPTTGTGNIKPANQPMTGTGQFQPDNQPMTSTGQFQSANQPMTSTGQFQQATQPMISTGQFQPANQPMTGSGQFHPAGQPTPGSGQFQPNGPALQTPAHYPPRRPPFMPTPQFYPSQMNQLNMMALYQHRGYQYPPHQYPPHQYPPHHYPPHQYPPHQYPSQYNAALLQHCQPPPQSYAHQRPPPAPAPAPASPAPAPAPLRLTGVEVRVYLQLVTVDARTAGEHLLSALARASERPGTDSESVRVPQLDADIFRKLVAIDADTAHRHMRALLESSARKKQLLNPMAREFPAPPSLQPAVRQFFNDAGECIRPPPGFESLCPAAAPFPALFPSPSPSPAPAPDSPDVD